MCLMSGTRVGTPLGGDGQLGGGVMSGSKLVMSYVSGRAVGQAVCPQVERLNKGPLASDCCSAPSCKGH